MRHRRWIVPVVLAACTAAGLAATTAPAEAKAKAKPVVISIGDSYISGEAGRWAGNSNGASGPVDALGPTAYFDNPTHTAEVIPGCHRASASLIHFSSDVTSVNLACSGATTSTQLTDSRYKPGIDFFDDGKGHLGQATMLRDAATGANVKLVVVSIGGNDFHFADIFERCVADFVLSLSIHPDYCNDDAKVLKFLTPAAVAHVRKSIVGSLHHVRTAMQQAGHADGTYDVVVLTYPGPIPAGTGIRYPQTGYTRLTTGGCPFWNADATWAAGTVLSLVNSTVRGAVADSGLQRIHVLDDADALSGRRLCEKTVGLLEETGLPSWQAPGAIDQLEWVQQIRTVSTIFGPYSLQESLHPNYFGQRALAACLALAWNKGKVRGGACTPKSPGQVGGNPIMQLN